MQPKKRKRVIPKSNERFANIDQVMANKETKVRAELEVRDESEVDVTH